MPHNICEQICFLIVEMCQFCFKGIRRHIVMLALCASISFKEYVVLKMQPDGVLMASFTYID